MPDRGGHAAKAITNLWIAPPTNDDDIAIDRTHRELLANEEMLRWLGIYSGGSGIDSFGGAHPFVAELGDKRSLHLDWESIQSAMSVRDPIKLTCDYTKTMMAFLFFHNRPRKIEMIGLGGGSLPKFCYCMLPDSDITVIEINPDVIALRDQFLIPRDDDRFRVICGDGADHVKDMASAPDILLIDGFDEFGQPPALCSAEFYDACYARLAQDGLIIVNLWKDHNYEEYALNIHCAFHGKTLAIPSETGSNQIVVAVKGAKLSLSRAQLDATCSLFPQHQANFLRSVGQRIVRQIERQHRR